MKSYRQTEFGGLDGLVMHTSDQPAPGPREVLVRVRATSLNFRDLIIMQGHYPGVPLGHIPISDAAGEIVALGEGVTRFRTGDRVVNSFLPEWFGGPLDRLSKEWVLNEDGWLTEYKVVPADVLVSMPAGYSFEQGATLPCAGVTAWAALAGIGPGHVVLTEGTGGVSLFAVQIAKLRGAEVVATTRSANKEASLRSLGVDEVINTTTTSAWGEAVRKFTGGRGVDRVIEVGGATTMAESIKAVRIGGEVAMIGVLAGFQGAIDYLTLFGSHATFRAIVVGSRRDLEDLCRALDQHGPLPTIDSVHSFDQARDAFARLASRDVTGKVVIRH